MSAWETKLLKGGGLLGTIGMLLVAAWQLLPSGSQERFIDWTLNLRATHIHETKVQAAVVPPWVVAQARCDDTEAGRQLQLAFNAADSDEARARVLIAQADQATRADAGADQSVSLLRSACELAGATIPTRAEALVRLGSAYLARREYESAQQAYQRVLAEPSASPLTAARARTGLAAIAVQREAFDKAGDDLARSEVVLQSGNDSAGLAELYLQLGNLQRRLSKPDLARQSYQRALVILQARPCGDPKQAFALSALGDLKLVYDSDVERARDFYRRALGHAETHTFPFEKARAMVGLATLDQKSGALSSAHKQLESALRIYETHGALFQQARAHEHLAEVCNQERDKACARQHSDNADRIKLELRLDPASSG